MILSALVERNIGILGMKSMANGILLKSKTVTPIECLHYALNLPTSVVITGIDSMTILDQAFNVAHRNAIHIQTSRGDLGMNSWLVVGSD